MLSEFDTLKTSARGVLQAILDQSQDCIKLVSVSGDLEYMNPNGQRAMGIEDFNSIAGKPWVDVWPKESADLIAQSIAAAKRKQRSRFDGYCPTATGEPRWWDVSVSPILDERSNVTHILAVSRDISTQKAERQAEREGRERAEAYAEFRDIVSREMRHRMKNLLSVVSSIARLTGQQKERTRDFLPIFSERVNDLAAAQYLLTEHEENRANVAQLVTRLVAHGPRDSRVELGVLPEVMIDDREAQVVALVLGELHTNAIKYGGLKDDAGWVRLDATRKARTIEFVWEECAGRPVGEPATKGSGTELMRRISTGQPSPVAIEWTGDGLIARFTIRAA